MEIAIIGTGSIGGTIARKLKTAGHRIRVANSKGPEGVWGFADEIGATAVDVQGAVDSVNVVILSIPLPAMAKLPIGLFDSVPRDVPIIDTSNYYPGMRDPQIPEIEDGMPESVWVSKQLGPGKFAKGAVRATWRLQVFLGDNVSRRNKRGLCAAYQ